MNDRETPMDKIHEYGSHYRCPKCDEIVDKYDRYCRCCGQRLNVEGIYHEGLKGWCAEK